MPKVFNPDRTKHLKTLLKGCAELRKKHTALAKVASDRLDKPKFRKNAQALVEKHNAQVAAAQDATNYIADLL